MPAARVQCTLPATRSVDNWSYTNDTHFQNITLRDHHLPTKNAAQLTPSLKVLAHALLENRDRPLTMARAKDGRLLARAPNYGHHLVEASTFTETSKPYTHISHTASLYNHNYAAEHTR